jgi:hypothetical protein
MSRQNKNIQYIEVSLFAILILYFYYFEELILLFKNLKILVPPINIV